MGYPRDLLNAANCVIFDFDGPVCDLFAEYTASDVVKDLHTWLEKDLEVAVPPGKFADDPLGYLGLVEQSHPGDPCVEGLEKRLTEQEERAAESARPTDCAAELICELVAVRVRLGIATNNSAAAAVAYLRRMRLDGSFGTHVHGRGQDIAKLKPDPDSLSRVLDSTGSKPEESVMIGDSSNDLIAADRLGVTFIAYAPESKKSRISSERIHERRWYGRMPVVTSLSELLGR
ncbi:HAD family hydrolase [Streptomyces sp. TLI_146]|uniref:HAD family hydrolase n=1 Tax=Streptomyces sp. TLI_146 TaxID=1938858 RepID=UPI0015D59239|nr:HAD-IA family hydrolase [Streptomyces sp. TLI_146]